MWMEREDISSPSGKGKNTAWGRTGVTGPLPGPLAFEAAP